MRLPRYHEILKDFSPVQSGDPLFDDLQQTRPQQTGEQIRKHWRSFTCGALLVAIVGTLSFQQCDAEPSGTNEPNKPTLFQTCVNKIMALPHIDPMAPDVQLAPQIIDRCSGAYSFENPDFSVPEVYDATIAAIDVARSDD